MRDAPGEVFEDHPILRRRRWWPGGKGIKTREIPLCASGPLAGSEAGRKSVAGFVRNDGGQSIAITKKVKIRAVESEGGASEPKSQSALRIGSQFAFIRRFQGRILRANLSVASNTEMESR